MILTANISDIDSMGSGNGGNGNGDDMMRNSMVVINARGVFPDLSTCSGLKFIIKEVQMTQQQQTDDDDDEKAYKYDGYKIDFGYKRNFSEDFSLAFSMKNIVSEFKSKDKLPQLIVLGTSQALNRIPLVFYFDIFRRS